MKSLMFAVLAAAGLSVAGVAQASADLAQKSGCMTCHAVDTKKMGPSFKDIAKKYKGNATAEADIVPKLKSGKRHTADKAGCSKCHAMDAKKMGSSYKDLAKKHKGTADADLVAKLKEGKGHPKTAASEADLQSLVKWIKSL
jgi:cytochrome c